MRINFNRLNRLVALIGFCLLFIQFALAQSPTSASATCTADCRES